MLYDKLSTAKGDANFFFCEKTRLVYVSSDNSYNSTNQNCMIVANYISAKLWRFLMKSANENSALICTIVR